MGKLSALTNNTGPSLSDKVVVVQVSGPTDTLVKLSDIAALLTPPGSIIAWGGSSAPSGWQLCDGSPLSRTTFAGLFGNIGTTWGIGDGTTTFNVPDLRGRVPAGFKTSDANFGTLGATGGEATHVLSQAEMPGHSHGLSSGIGFGAGPANAALGRADQNSPATLWGSFGIGSTGGGGAHNNLQPYATTNFIIKT